MSHIQNSNPHNQTQAPDRQQITSEGYTESSIWATSCPTSIFFLESWVWILDVTHPTKVTEYVLYTKCNSKCNICLHVSLRYFRNLLSSIYQDIKIEIEDIRDVFVGFDFQFSVHVKNTGRVMHCVKRLVLKVLNKTYFGAITGQAQRREFESLQLTPGQSESSIPDTTVPL